MATLRYRIRDETSSTVHLGMGIVDCAGIAIYSKRLQNVARKKKREQGVPAEIQRHLQEAWIVGQGTEDS